MSEISRLVFSGGGAKGVLLAGAYRALKHSGVLDEVEAVSGASAGAIMAALTAFGASEHQINEAILKQKITTLYGKSKGIAYFYDGEPLLAFLRQQISTAILENLPNIETKADDYFKLTHLKHKAEAIIEHYQTKKAGSPPDTITFNDLALLNELAPKHFKKLYINTNNKTTSQKNIFSCDNCDQKNVEVAKIVQASSALPVLFATVDIDGERHYDGGHSDNIPVDNFDDGAENERPNETLVLGFAEKDGAMRRALDPDNSEERLYQPSLFDKLLRDVMPRVMLGLDNSVPDNTQQKNEGFKRLRRYRENVIALPTGNIKTGDFKKAYPHHRTLAAIGYLETINFLANKRESLAGDQCDFNKEFCITFCHIFEAVSATKNNVPNQFLTNLATVSGTLKDSGLQPPNPVYYQILVSFIKKHSIEHLDSDAAFCVGLAVDYVSGTDLSLENLQREVYLRSFKNSYFKHSRVTGRSFFTHRSLQNQDFNLTKSPNGSGKKRRRDIILEKLEPLAKSSPSPIGITRTPTLPISKIKTSLDSGC
jgi:predicted acylesterase/phospholipase RssA